MSTERNWEVGDRLIYKENELIVIKINFVDRTLGAVDRLGNNPVQVSFDDLDLPAGTPRALAILNGHCGLMAVRKLGDADWQAITDEKNRMIAELESQLPDDYTAEQVKELIKQ